MNITFMLFYYEPENPTINYLFQPIWEALIAEGHKINIITPNPTRGIPPQAQLKYNKTTIETFDNMTIHRVKCFTYKAKSFTKYKLLRRYISVSRKLARHLKKVDSDLVFVSSNPPLLYSYLVTRYCAHKKIPVIYNVQDIYPDNIFKRNSFLYKIFDPLQVKSLKRASEVITISETMRKTLLKKGDFNDKINVIYNFDISEVAKLQTAKTAYFDPLQFNVVYAGNIGYVQDVDLILAAAKILLHDPRINFHIFGEGSQAQRIAMRIRNENIVNTTFYPAVSVEDSAALYKNADVNVISILPGIIETALPLKTASCIAAQKPIVFVGLESFYHSEEWVNDMTNLYTVNYRNYEKFAEIIKELASKCEQKQTTLPTSTLFDKEQNIRAYVTLITKQLALKKKQEIAGLRSRRKKV